MPSKSFYITSPIYYVNDIPHIGHAYTNIACDVIARFMRLDGMEVMFVTGTDEHGQKVQKASEKANVPTQQFVDNASQKFKEMNEILNISNDFFVRTSADWHKQSVIDAVRFMVEKGDIYLGKYCGWYAVRDEAFYAENEIKDGKAPTGAEVEWVEEPSYFFRLSNYQDKLLKFFDDNPSFIQPEGMRNEIINFVNQGLSDLSISRISFSWGIPMEKFEYSDSDGNKKVGFDADSATHIMYVWLDALLNYVSCLGYNSSNTSEKMHKYWPASVHVVGKDILRFHTIYWPAFLMSLNLELPKCVIAHGWWTNEGQKMSKSIGNVINPIFLVDKYNLDATRYYLMRGMSFGHDADFAQSMLINTVNVELCNKLGNLCQRTLMFIFKNLDGKIPNANSESLYEREEILKYSLNKFIEYKEHMQKYAISKALQSIVDIVYEANRYIDHEAPWVLKKTDIARMNEVLYTVCELIKHIAIMISPFIPDSAQKIWKQLGLEQSMSFDEIKKTIQCGNSIGKIEPIFSILE